jgi:hypothetical protein
MARHSHRSPINGRWATAVNVSTQEGREMADPGDLARPEQASTGFNTPAFTQAEYALDANHQMAKQMFAQRQAQQPELAELHRQAVESARSEQAQPQQERAMRGQPGRDYTTMFPESAVRSGIEAAARSGHARGYQLGRKHAAAGVPAPARAAGPVFGGRDVSENMTNLAQEETE